MELWHDGNLGEYVHHSSPLSQGLLFNKSKHRKEMLETCREGAFNSLFVCFAITRCNYILHIYSLTKLSSLTSRETATETNGTWNAEQVKCTRRLFLAHIIDKAGVLCSWLWFAPIWGATWWFNNPGWLRICHFQHNFSKASVVFAPIAIQKSVEKHVWEISIDHALALPGTLSHGDSSHREGWKTWLCLWA